MVGYVDVHVVLSSAIYLEAERAAEVMLELGRDLQHRATSYGRAIAIYIPATHLSLKTHSMLHSNALSSLQTHQRPRN